MDRWGSSASQPSPKDKLKILGKTVSIHTTHTIAHIKPISYFIFILNHSPFTPQRERSVIFFNGQMILCSYTYINMFLLSF